MRITTAFNRLLDLTGVWVRTVSFQPDRVVVTVRLKRRRLQCPKCSYTTSHRESKQHHESPPLCSWRQHSWRHTFGSSDRGTCTGARPTMRHMGRLRGDELMPRAGIVATRVVEIEALPSAIWPWLVQTGPDRGGAYTYDWIERRVGIDIRNVDRIIPEFQDLKVGDEIQMPGYNMRVERLDPERALVFRSSHKAWLWAFELRPTDGRTRLISRNSFDTSKLRFQDWIAYPIIEPGSWVMERKMLLTIKQRAETLAQAQSAGPAAVTGSQGSAVAT